MEPSTAILTPEEKLAECLGQLRRRKTFVLDLETTGLSPKLDRIVGVAVAVSEDKGWYLDFDGSNGLPFLETMEKLKPFFLDRDKLWVNQNLGFDLKFLAEAGVTVNCKLACTMVAAHLTDETRAGSHRLGLKGKGGLIDEVFDEVLETWKESSLGGNLFGKSPEVYGIDDATWTLKLWNYLAPLTKRMGLEKYFWEVAMPNVRIVAGMELAGVKVDVPYLWKLRKQLLDEKIEIEKKVQDRVGFKINIGSPEQLSKWIFSPSGGGQNVPPGVAVGSKGLASTNEECLSKLGAEGFEVAEWILGYRGRDKLLGTYVEKFINLATKNSESRIYCSLNQTGTETGRLSSDSPNLQNIPSEDDRVRQAFIAPEGKLFLDADFGQLELRIMAHLSQDERMVNAFVNGEDLHAITQEALQLESRRLSKAVNFGLIYGMHAETFQRNLWVKSRIRKPLEDCEKWRYGFFELYPGIKAYHERIKKQLNEKGFVQTMTGRYRHLEEEMEVDYGHALRSAFNAPVQGGAADIILISMRNIDRELKKRALTDLGWLQVVMLLQVHDELLFEVPVSLAASAKKLVVDLMESSVKLRVPLISDAKLGRTWAECKSGKFVMEGVQDAAKS